MSKKLIASIIPIAVLFAGLSPGYDWAVPLAIGMFAIIGVLIANDYSDDRAAR